jgi:hypothetical protein
MAKKPELQPQPTTWTIYKIAAKAVRLGTVGAPDEAAAMDCSGTPPLGRRWLWCERLSAVPHAAPALYHLQKGRGSARLSEADSAES